MKSHTLTLPAIFAASLKVMPLQDISRIVVRRILRRNIQIENPNIDQKLPRKQKKLPDRQHRINLMPLETGLMIMNQLTDSDNSDPENEEPVRAEETGGQIIAGEDTHDDEIRDHVFSRLLFPPLRIGRGRYEELQRNLEGEEAAGSGELPLEVDNGFVEGCDDQGVDGERVDCAEVQASKAGSETISIRNRKQTSSSNGFSSASYSSGFGTCGSLDVESIALDSQFPDDADGTSCDAINGNGDLPAWDTDFDMAVAEDEAPAYWPEADSPSPQASVFRSTFATSSPSYEPPQCEEETKPAAVQEPVAGGNERKEKPPSSGTMYRALLRQKVLALPVPVPLKNFLLFYRK